MQKLYCYVDESGQDTFAQKGRWQMFVVGVAVLEQDRDELARVCEQYETASGKGKFKWGQAERTRRLRFLRLILADDRFSQALRFAVYDSIGLGGFDAATVDAVARAILWKAPAGRYEVHVYVDGLAKSKRTQYRRALKAKGVLMGEVKGVPREESNPLTRLADALAGFVRDALEGHDAEAAALLERALRDGEMVRV